MTPIPPLSPRLLTDPVHLLALGLGSGLAPKAPGTAGTALAVLLYLPLITLPWYLYLVLVVVLCGVGVWLCGESARRLGVHDHPAIVWDEIVGFFVTMFLAPSGWVWILLGFVLFRLFDILKPWPIRWLDRQVKGGLGIMVDDLLAGLFSLGILQLIAYLLKS